MYNNDLTCAFFCFTLNKLDPYGLQLKKKNAFKDERETVVIYEIENIY